MKELFDEFVNTVHYVINKTVLPGCIMPTKFNWGYKNPKIYHNENFTEEFYIFEVSGLKHTGRVKIIMDRGQDLFTIELLKPRKNEVVYSIDSIYIDMLVETIDKLIETEGYQ